MLFSQIPGHKELKHHLTKSVRENRVSHAQLFLGPEGSGSLALALAYAQYLCCTDKKADDSCGQCSSCSKYQKFIHPDLHFSYPFIATNGPESKATDVIAEWREFFLKNPYAGVENWLQYLGAENKQGNINIAECHDIIRKLSLKPFEGEFKVLIMWLPEYLKEVGNALLKIVEEPPEKTLFLFVAENRELLLNTILSRTQLVKVNRFTDEEIEQYLNETYEVSASQAARIAYLANGNMNEALTLVSEEANDNETYFAEWMRLCFRNDGTSIVSWVEGIAKIGRENQKNFLRYSLEVVRDCLLINSGASGIVRFNGKELDIHKFSQYIQAGNGAAVIAQLEKALYHIERNANPKILFLDLSIQMMKLLKSRELSLFQ